MPRLVPGLFLTILLAAPATAAGPMGQWDGVVFFCASDPKQDWTRGSCAAITEEVVRQVEAAGLKIAVLLPVDEPDHASKQAAAAGFDNDRALSMLFRFVNAGKPDSKTALDFTAQLKLDLGAGDGAQWRTVGTQTTTLDPGEWPDESEDAAALVFKGLLEYFIKERNAPS